MHAALWLFILVLGLCPGLGIFPALAGDAPRGAKDLFFSSDEPSGTATPAAGPAAGVTLGVAYWIELTSPSGPPRRVTTDHIFRSGDRIRLIITANREGYLLILNIGSSGRSRLLFPYAQMQPNANLVQANAPIVIPQRGAIRFDDTPGEEVLLLMLSPQPMQSPVGAGPAAQGAPPGPTGYSPEQTSQLLSTAAAKGAKDLVVETDTTGATPASYAVAPLSSLHEGMITVRITLKHQ